VSSLLDLSTTLFLRVNDFARTSTWLHAPAVAYA
jgi:undecaprenyl-diphosphatase